jgi:transcriptional regulator with XRE-family HTH domain
MAIETDDPEVLRQEISSVLEKVTDRGSLLFFHWIFKRIANNDPLPPDDELKALHGAFVRIVAAFAEKKPPPAGDLALVNKWIVVNEAAMARAVGTAVRFFRERVGMSRLTLSKKCAVPLRLILALERGRGPDISVPILLHLVQTLGTDIDEFGRKVIEFGRNDKYASQLLRNRECNNAAKPRVNDEA